MGQPYPFMDSIRTVLFLLLCLRILHLLLPFVQRLESPAPARRKERKMYFNQVEFGQRVQESRKFAGMTQEELADRLGIDKNHVSRIERGAKACSIDILVELSGVLRVSTDYLLTGKSIDREMTRTQVLSVISQLSLIAQNL